MLTKTDFVAALRSTMLPQARHTYVDRAKCAVCAMSAAAAEIPGVTADFKKGILTKDGNYFGRGQIQTAYGLSWADAAKVIELNDKLGLTFNQIANQLEEEWCLAPIADQG